MTDSDLAPRAKRALVAEANKWKGAYERASQLNRERWQQLIALETENERLHKKIKQLELRLQFISSNPE